ncbi:hypothetical protein [Streptomyces meridianus]|uniref:Uncharacterized protein n=1 Tax=Streptomyces meridianus TaxID=2938945 RepID=A0ABT0X8C5_9ACTN|nr:hypothetical protein [Streptomyces meridianus]MCM2578784.1 hypothetical protein [Streptomyces meridianus]
MPRPDCRGNGLVRLLFLAAVTGLWWWTALRLIMQPDRAGMVETLFLAGGWSLSLLPVHCVPAPRTPRHRSRSLLWRQRGDDPT